MGSELSIRLGARIRALRKARGWRIVDLAEHSGVREVHLSYLERGPREIGFNALVAISQGLGVPLAELLKDIEKVD